jgi:hypothetical protein
MITVKQRSFFDPIAVAYWLHVAVCRLDGHDLLAGVRVLKRNPQANKLVSSRLKALVALRFRVSFKGRKTNDCLRMVPILFYMYPRKKSSELDRMHCLESWHVGSYADCNRQCLKRTTTPERPYDDES